MRESAKVDDGAVVVIKLIIAFEIVQCESYLNSFWIILCELKLLQSTIGMIVVYRASIILIVDWSSFNLSNEHEWDTNAAIQLTKLTKISSDLPSFGGKCVFNGVSNFPNIDWIQVPLHASSYASQMFMNFWNFSKLVQKVHKPTRGNRELDVVICSVSKLIRDVFVWAPTAPSDHYSLYYKVKIFMDPL